LDLQLDIARQTLASRQESLKLTQTLERGGATSLVDVRQAKQLIRILGIQDLADQGEAVSNPSPTSSQ
jgi:outer membrane protein TolC